MHHVSPGLAKPALLRVSSVTSGAQHIDRNICVQARAFWPHAALVRFLHISLAAHTPINLAASRAPSATDAACCNADETSQAKSRCKCVQCAGNFEQAKSTWCTITHETSRTVSCVTLHQSVCKKIGQQSLKRDNVKPGLNVFDSSMLT